MKVVVTGTLIEATLELTATVHPGYTPGRAFYTLTSRDQSITFTGDITHIAAVQGPGTSVAITYDVDPNRAVSVRHEAFSRFAKDRTLVAVPHLVSPASGT